MPTQSTDPTHVAPPLGSWVAADYDVVAEFSDLMPTGVTVTDEGSPFRDGATTFPSRPPK
ncbi:hypothetical protein FB570_101675 [Streptomyces sp. T12]|nr:hypothetical protein FB570_101675 [Streptomyces sp. T12]